MKRPELAWRGTTVVAAVGLVLFVSLAVSPPLPISAASLADGVVVAHLLYVAFVVLMVPIIVVGGFADWSWVRSGWLRIAHLAAMVFVACEALTGVTCPLTTWEYYLRRAAGAGGWSGRSFVGRWANDLLFVDASEDVLTFFYLLFTLLIVATFLFVPPRWPRRQP